jgi:hypothetical protein
MQKIKELLDFLKEKLKEVEDYGNKTNIKN